LNHASYPAEPGLWSPRSVQGVLSAIPDFGLAALFLITWLVPRAFQEKMVSYLILLMLLEFIIIHSSAFLGQLWVSKLPKGIRVLALLGMGLFYSLFVAAFSATQGEWWPMVAFWGLTFNKVGAVLLGRVPEGEEKEQIAESWVATVLFYLAFGLATSVLPLPGLGINAEVIRLQEFSANSSGLWLEQPQRVMLFGFLYFSALGLFTLFQRGALQHLARALQLR
jgi:hypothetical protein